AELSDVVLDVFGIVETAILARNTARAETAFDMARLAEPENSRLNFLDAQLNQLKLRDRVAEARVAIRDNRFEDAGTLISQARSLAGSDTTEVDFLTEELSTARGQQEVSSTLALANERLDAGNLISPVNNNARYYFANVLASDPNNVAAQTGLLGVASELALQASGAINRNDFAAADTLLNEARALD
ncbi:MAG: hypothetical protein ACKVJN_15205, partial [Woeseiales bacterium]